MKRKLVSSLIFIATLAGCFGQKKVHMSRRLEITTERKDSAKINQDQQPTMTVLVHGTFNGPILNHAHGCPGHGLWKAHDIPKTYYLSYVLKTLSEQSPNRFKFDTLYAFDCSGALNFKKREEAAQLLYTAVSTERARIQKKHGFMPRLRIITVSHGGNVVLNLAKVKPKTDTGFIVDELIMLCCPIQKATAPYVNDHIFKRIYSLYSVTDLTQVIDPQGVYKNDPCKKQDNHKAKKPLFSERTFKEHTKALQTRLTYNGRGMAHAEFLWPHFVHILPIVLEELEEWYDELKENPERPMSNVEYILKIRT